LPSTQGMQLHFDASKSPCVGNVSGVLGGSNWQAVLSCNASIVSLVHQSGLQLAGSSNPLAMLVVPEMNAPQVQKVWTDHRSGRVVAHAITAHTAVTFEHWVQFDFNSDFVNVTVWLGKSPDEINGGAAGYQVYLHFNPAGADPKRWIMDQKGIPVPVTFPNQCSLRHYQCVQSGMSHPEVGIEGVGQHFQITSLDVPLVAFLAPDTDMKSIMHMHLMNSTVPDLSKGSFWNLMATLEADWLRQYPWKQEDYWTKYRFALELRSSEKIFTI